MKKQKTIRGVMNVLDSPTYSLAKDAGLGSHQNVLWVLLSMAHADLYCAFAKRSPVPKVALWGGVVTLSTVASCR